MESITDRCEDVANVIEGIVLKNGVRRTPARMLSPAIVISSSWSRSSSTSSTASTTRPTRSPRSSRRACSRPLQAVIWAAFFNFVAAFVFGVQVAHDHRQGRGGLRAGRPVGHPRRALGAITWNLITWYCGLPSSSSHALVGGFAGAAVAAGFGALMPSGLLKIARVHRAGAPARPRRGLLADARPRSGSFRSAPPSRVDRLFRRLQLVSAAAYSLGHGGNDAQKTMGIIAVLLFSAVTWARVPRADLGGPRRHAAIGLGTLVGGWRIVKTMGRGSPSCARSAASAPRRRARSCSSAPAWRHPGLHDPHDHRRDRRRRRHAAALRRALGRGRADRLGVDPHDPGLSAIIAAAVWGAIALIVARLG